ncbi:hypothetical protein [Streptomyces noursei]|uniref:hypothetical protein n=1 Tax=Streptomyces noursei TaxID=1971 RepID=UPI0030F22ECA
MLFTEPVARLTLADLLAKGPQQTGELMTRAAVELAGLQQPAVARAVDAAAIAERRIGSTFDRKFNGISGPTYLRKAGQAGEALSTVVLRLRLRLRLRRLRPAPTAGHLLPVIYGALKPDHVVFPDGADGRPVFLDPGLGRGRPQTDAAKLISRTVLGLIAASPDLAAADATAPGIEEFADTLTATRPGRAGRVAAAPGGAVAHGHHQPPQHLPDLTCPPDLPLPELAGKLTAHAEMVCGLLETTTAGLVAGTDPRAVWRLALADVVKAATALSSS